MPPTAGGYSQQNPWLLEAFEALDRAHDTGLAWVRHEQHLERLRKGRG